MAQDGQTEDRVTRIADALSPKFDAVRWNLAQRIAEAEEGQLIEQTEMDIFEELNRLKSHTQEAGLQARIDEAEADFFPSGQTGEAAEQGNRRLDAADDQRRDQG